jgi:23S rRNA (adenine2503-C2)-methyltransferase
VTPARPPSRDAALARPVPLTLLPDPPGLIAPAGRRGRPPRHLADLDLAGARAAVAELGEPPFRAEPAVPALLRPLHRHPDDMTDLPLTSRTALADALLPPLLTAERELSCDDGTTRKTLWRAFDGALVESVLMRYPDRVTMCVSSQAGCGMACPFCATGQAGLTRNLSTAEIVAQVVAGARAGQRPGPGAGRAGSPTWCSWAWGSRWPTTPACWPPSAG